MIRINLSISSWASVHPCNHVQTFKIFGASIYYIDRIPTKNIRKNFQTSPRRYVNKGISRRKNFYCLNRITRMQRWSGLTYQCHPEHPSIRVILFRHLIELFREIRSAPFPKQNGDLFRVHSLSMSSWASVHPCNHVQTFKIFGASIYYIDRISTQNIRRNFQTSPRRYVNKGIFRRKKFYCLNKIARMAKMLRINLSISSWASVNPCNLVQTFKIFGASIYYIDRISTKNIRRNFQTSPRRYVNKGVFRHKKFYCLNKIARMAKMIRINLSISSWASVNPCNHVQTFKFFVPLYLYRQNPNPKY